LRFADIRNWHRGNEAFKLSTPVVTARQKYVARNDRVAAECLAVEEHAAG
jgi:hypothetical protein